MNSKGMILIECIFGLVALFIVVNIVVSIAQLIYSLQVLQYEGDMNDYWFNLSHFLIYFPWPEPIVDIQY